MLGAWPGGDDATRAMNPPTMPGAPAVTEYAEPQPTPEPEAVPPRRSGRGWVIAALVVALLAGVGVAAYLLRGDDDDPGSGAVELTPAAMERAVGDYYDLLPDQADQAWDRLSPRLQTQGKQNYLDRWSAVDSVDVTAQPQATGADTVRVGIRLKLGDGSVRNEVHSLTLVTSPERLLIDGDELLREDEAGPPETTTTQQPTTEERPTTTRPTTTTTTTTTTTETTTTTPPVSTPPGDGEPQE